VGVPVVIAHADGEEHLADKLGRRLQAAGYEVAHRGTVLVGESFVEEASKALSQGGPVVVCGTVNALGTGWAHRVTNAARHDYSRTRVFILRMDHNAYVEPLSFDGRVAEYWQNPDKAMGDLLASLNKYFPIDDRPDGSADGDAETRYRQLALDTCDIIDLANLPEDDRHLSARNLELRCLYVPLRVRVEVPVLDADTDDRWAEIEAHLVARRRPPTSVGGWADPYADEVEHLPIGERLEESRRLVVLGDPGAGKTTMLRWVATSYLLRLKHDPDWRDLPDVATLPDEDWLPILVRCRDLDARVLGGSLESILGHVLRKAELAAHHVAAMQTLILRRMTDGTALLLLDGLDEIIDLGLRGRFCGQIEQVRVAYPHAPIVVTSRIVGYRELGRRIGRGFEHLTVADLGHHDKDAFVRRWCALTETPVRRDQAADELVQDIHSSDRIERMTGNPMLLTTMALVKRKVGKLPSRRADLYWEAVQVLINWRRDVDEPLDLHEAVPQLEYLAYAMCERGVQQLRRNEILELLEGMRAEYPQIHALLRHTPEDFLALLERRTGIVVEVGEARHAGRRVAVYEFRHLTFQEYLAALALVDGRYPGRDRSKSLAETIAPLAGRTTTNTAEFFDEEWAETVVTEQWSEVIRLVVALCNDDDVDATLSAILHPLPGEDPPVTRRPRAVLAAQGLADEPNTAAHIGEIILRSFSKIVDEWDGHQVATSVSSTAYDLAGTQWSDLLQTILLEEFLERVPGSIRLSVGGLFAEIAAYVRHTGGRGGWRSWDSATGDRETTLRGWLVEGTEALHASDERRATEAALTIMHLAYRGRLPTSRLPTIELVDLLDRASATAVASAWALCEIERASGIPVDAFERLLRACQHPAVDPDVVTLTSFLLKDLSRDDKTASLVVLLESLPPALRAAACRPLVRNGKVGSALGLLSDTDSAVRATAAEVLCLAHERPPIECLAPLLEDADPAVRLAVLELLADMGYEGALDGLIEFVDNPEIDEPALSRSCRSIGKIGGERAIGALLQHIASTQPALRKSALGGLAETATVYDRVFLSRDLNGKYPFLDPADPIGRERILRTCEQVERSFEEVDERYRRLAQDFGLTLAPHE